MNKSIVIYTSIFGGYDGLLPQPKIKGADYVCFTDRPVRASPWDIRIMNPQFSDPVRCAKEYKIVPHRFFSEYEYSVWIDGNYLVVGDIRKLIATVLHKKNMAFFDHNQTVRDARDCLYKEYEWMIEQGRKTGKYKADPEIMSRQIERYKKEGFPRNNGLIFASILIRRHNEPNVRQTMEHWWSEIVSGSRRDQLSFNYVAWKDRFDFHVINGNIRRNPWFYQIGIHRSNYRWKLLRFRLRRLFGSIKYR